MNLESLVQKLPGVAKPEKRLAFNEKLKWTAMGLIVYFLMSQIYVWGISEGVIGELERLQVLFGASMGTLLTLGIGPIVTSSILLQLLVGAGVIKWDLSTHHGKVMFQGTQKIFAIVLAVVEAFAYTIMGAVKPINMLPLTVLLVVFQLSLGAWIVIYLDEVISKWGFGSGVSLFIAAGVSKTIVIRLLSPGVAGTSMGILPALAASISRGSPDFLVLLPLLSTLIVFSVVVYAQSMRVEIPLAFGSVRGFGRKWPLKFIYTSNMPVILTAALLINVQTWARLLASRGVTILGTFSNGVAQSGLVYYLNPPRTFIYSLLTGNIVGTEVLQVICYTSFMVLGSIMFSVFWVTTSNMDPKTVASQIQRSGMNIPGFRRDARIIERILSRYIPHLAVLGGAFVGLLAAFADFTGALAGGTGILLTVMIVFQLYEEIAMQHAEDMYPMLKKYVQR